MIKEKIKDMLNKSLGLLKRPKVLIIIGCVLYLETPFVVLFKEGWFNTNLAALYINPFKLLWKLLHPTVFLAVIEFNIVLVIFAVLSMIILYSMGYGEKMLSFDNIKTFVSNIKDSEEKKINYSKDSGSHGTARWFDLKDISKLKQYISIGTNEGILFGYLRGTKRIISLPIETYNNRNVAVFGASGSMKSRSFVIPNILNLMQEGESMIITDPKGELLRKTYGILEKNGYIVRALNLNNIECSDQWNMLREVTDDITAVTFAKAIMENTSDDKSTGGFWDIGQENLLKALSLYIITEKSEDKKTMRELYGMITMNDVFNNLKKIFSSLPSNHISIQPWNTFLSSGNEKVYGGMISGLATRLQLFQSEKIKGLTDGNDIQVDLPGRKKCAYFIVVPDSNSAFDFIPGLFFSFSFMKLTSLADRKIKGELDVHVNFLMDEFPNIARIPDFKKKISTIRSREISVCVIFQNIAQLQQRYPDGQWEEILGNCDNKVFLGAGENTTAKFISDTLGVATISEESVSKEKFDFNPFKGRVSGRESGRNLLNPDEVLKMNPFHSILMLKGQDPIKTEKMDYTKHELYKEMKDIPIHEMLKDWSTPFHEKWLEDRIKDNIVDDEQIEKMKDEEIEENKKVLNRLREILDSKINAKEEDSEEDSKEKDKKLLKENKFTENFFKENDIIENNNVKLNENHSEENSIELDGIIEDNYKGDFIDYTKSVNKDIDTNNSNSSIPEENSDESSNVKDDIKSDMDSNLDHILKLKNLDEEKKKNTMSNLDGLF